MPQEFTPPNDRPKTGTKVFLPHEWNAKITAKQKKRGEAKNLPLLPDAVRRTHTMTDKPPKMRDPRKLAKMQPGPVIELGDSGSDPQDLTC